MHGKRRLPISRSMLRDQPLSQVPSASNRLQYFHLRACSPGKEHRGAPCRTDKGPCNCSRSGGRLPRINPGAYRTVSPVLDSFFAGTHRAQGNHSPPPGFGRGQHATRLSDKRSERAESCRHVMRQNGECRRSRPTTVRRRFRLHRRLQPDTMGKRPVRSESF